MDKNMHRIKRIGIIILTILIAVFLIWNILWFFYRQQYFVKIVQDSTSFSESTDIEKSYIYQETEQNTDTIYSYSVFFPHYLRFDNNYCCLPSLDIDENGMYSNDYFAAITIKPRLFRDYRYIVTIYDLKTANELFLAGKNDYLEYDVYVLEVNDEMQIIKELTYGGALIMQNAYTEVEKTFNKAKDVFVE